MTHIRATFYLIQFLLQRVAFATFAFVAVGLLVTSVLAALEPEVLEIAAQMSHISKELAEVYSNDRVARARSFLTERQFEVDQFNARLTEAKAMSTELKHWMHEIELEESVAAAQLQRLREVMPELGLETIIRTDNTVVELPPKAAE